MEIRVLGPLEVERDGTPVALGPKQQTLLAILLVNRGAPVTADRIVEDLYAGRPPDNAVKTLHVHVSRLRKALGDGALVTSAGGYRVSLDDGLDADEFERLAVAGRSALADGKPDDASRLLHEALALWRGPAPASRGASFESWSARSCSRTPRWICSRRRTPALRRPSHRTGRPPPAASTTAASPARPSPPSARSSRADRLGDTLSTRKR